MTLVIESHHLLLYFSFTKAPQCFMYGLYTKEKPMPGHTAKKKKNGINGALKGKQKNLPAFLKNKIIKAKKKKGK